MNRKAWAVALAAALALASVRATAVDGIALEAGRGNDTDMGRIAIQSDWSHRWFQAKEWHVGGYWELGVGYWDQNSLPDENGSIAEVGLTPVFRFQRNELAGSYVELAVGIHFLSRAQIGARRMSTSFQFGDHIGLGYRFGSHSAWDVSYRYQHLSNGGIKNPNHGINFSQVRLQYHF